MIKPGNVPKYWRTPLLALFVFLAIFFVCFWRSWASLVNIWSNSNTFTHCFLVFPASLWLVWSQKERYVSLHPQPSYFGVAALFLFGLGWLLAQLARVSVVGQFALVGMLIALIWSVLGSRIAESMLFPLCFLFLMVPFGEDFVPYLMEYTATFVVSMLRLSGVSVYRDGFQFTLVTGNWSVVEACSGIRYLIASFTLGLIYAYLNYTSYLKRLVFVVVSILLPILANGMRAYMIVMIGHLSDMKLATGIDHIVYGWVFFGFVMLILFYVGSFWVDYPDKGQAATSQIQGSGELVPNRQYVVMTLILLGLTIWPLSADLYAKQFVRSTIPDSFLQNFPQSDLVTPNWLWRPSFQGVAHDVRRFVVQDDKVVGLYFASFDDDADGELVSSRNLLINSEEGEWRPLHRNKFTVEWTNSAADLDEFVISNQTENILILRWYRLGSVNTSNGYYAKWLQLKKRLIGDDSPELMMLLYTSVEFGNYSQARNVLREVALACCE